MKRKNKGLPFTDLSFLLTDLNFLHGWCILLLAVFCASAVSCGNPVSKPAAESSSVRHFQVPAPPSVYKTGQERAEYVLNHYWDAFLGADGPTDSATVLGVPKAEVETAMSTFASSLDALPLPKARDAVKAFFGGVAALDTLEYVLMTQMVARYLYDPNSPVRNEDYYLPFVKGMISCGKTPSDMVQAYRFEAEGCEICQGGTIAPDFYIRTIKGTGFRMHDVKAAYTMLFFSNPGCHACKDIIEQVQSNPTIREMIDGGFLAVVNVYIDEDLKAWREYEHNYPSTWRTGYDKAYRVRGERLYDVRAIPSLYLLDYEKRIIFKDAPVEKVLNHLLQTVSRQ